MTIIEAIKSGKPFKRPYYVWIISTGLEFVEFITNRPVKLNPEDILADDWEIKQEPREFELWRSQFGDTWNVVPPEGLKWDSSVPGPVIIKVREVIG